MKKLFFVALSTLIMCSGLVGCEIKETQETAPAMEQRILNDDLADASPKKDSLVYMNDLIKREGTTCELKL